LLTLTLLLVKRIVSGAAATAAVSVGGGVMRRQQLIWEEEEEGWGRDHCSTSTVKTGVYLPNFNREGEEEGA